MKMQLAVAAVMGVGLLVGGSLLVAQQAAKPVDATAALIGDLDSNQFNTRRQAHAELLKLGKPAIPTLKKALMANPSLEVATRLREIIRKLSIRDDAGPAAGDLQVRLVADKKAVKLGDTVKFTVTVFNLSEDDLNLQTGYSTCGNYFECGSAFSRLTVGPNKDTKEVRAGCRVGFCGTGAGPIFDTIAGEKSREYVTAATFAKQENGPLGFTFGPSKYFVLEAPAEGQQTVRVALNIAPEANQIQFGGKFGGRRPENDKAPYWTGIVHSNDVQLAVGR